MGKLEQLTQIPVDKVYAERLVDILEAHGAKPTQTGTKKHPPDAERGRTFYEYAIDFPEGTVREYGMGLLRSTPFTIYFPDAYELPGSEISPINGDEIITILFIPK